MKRIYFLILILLLLSMAACSSDSSNDDGRLSVVATTGQIHDAVRNIAGDRVDLTGLLGPGIESSPVYSPPKEM